MNERQKDLITSIVQEKLELFMERVLDDLEESLSAEIKEASYWIQEEISNNMELIEQLGAQEKRTERKEGAGKHEAKRSGTKMEDGCLVPALDLVRIILMKQNCKQTIDETKT